MPHLDMRTTMLMLTLVTGVCAGAVLTLWRRAFDRYSGVGYWAADLVLLFSGMLLLSTRGYTPDLVSMVLANALMMGSLLMMRPALGAFAGLRVSMKADLAIYGVYLGVLCYFSLVKPSLPARNVALNIFTVFLCGRAAWMALFVIPQEFRSYAKPIVYSMCAFIAIAVLRLFRIAVFHDEWDFLTVGAGETFLYMTYACALIALTISIFMMLGRRLMDDRERGLVEKMDADRQRAESEARFQKVFQAAPMLMSLSEIETGRYLAVNDKFCEVSGYARNEVIGRSSVEIGWISAEARAELVRAAGAGPSLRIPEIELCAKGGRKVVCAYACERVSIGSRDILLAIAEDVTEMRKAEAAARTAHKLDSLGTLAGGIAHDFNNMLTGVAGNLSLIRKRAAENGDISDLLSEAESACIAAKGLARQLLTFASGGKPVLTALNLERLLREAVSFSLRGSPVKETFMFSGEALAVIGDREQLFQVIQNICLNAVQAMPGPGRFVVSLSESPAPSECGLPPGPYAAMRFADTGGGIPDKTMERLFEPYFSTKGGGRGLGLAASRSIVRKHGGEITVANENGGAVFTVYVPLTSQLPEKNMSPKTAKSSSAGGRVLVLEDEVIVHKALRRMLTELGYEVEVTEDGKDAIKAWKAAKAEGRPFLVAIMDLTIPGGMGGAEAAKQLKAFDPEARILASSGYSDAAVMADYKENGFDGVLPKPYRLEELSLALYGQG